MKLVGIKRSETSLTNAKWKKINELDLQLLKAGDLQELQACFMQGLNELIPHKKSFFDMGYIKNGQASFFDPFSLNMSDNELSEYYDSYQSADYIAWLLPEDEAVYYRDSTIISKELRERSPFYKQWLKPMGVYYSIGSTLFCDGRLYGSITAFREEEADFSDEDVYVLRLLSEFLTARLKLMFPNGIADGRRFKYDDEQLKKHLITNREREIIGFICDGLTNREIADKLCISESTVKKHNNSIFAKFSVSSRTQLLREISEQI